MIEINDILEWKQAYGEIFQMQIQEEHYIFKAIGREEYKQIILMNLTLGEFQEALCFNTVIYPTEYDFSNGIAGIAEVLSDAILDASGLHEGQSLELISSYREEMENFDYQVDCMIHEAFPEYSLEEISNWPVRKTMFYLSRAEWILTYLKGAPIDIYGSIQQEEQQEPNQQQQPQPQREMPQPPPQREIRRELIEAPEEVKPKPVQSPPPEGGIQSEEELLAMLEGSGAKVSKPSSDMNEVKPELNWFSYMDDLQGDFD